MDFCCTSGTCDSNINTTQKICIFIFFLSYSIFKWLDSFLSSQFMLMVHPIDKKMYPAVLFISQPKLFLHITCQSQICIYLNHSDDFKWFAVRGLDEVI